MYLRMTLLWQSALIRLVRPGSWIGGDHDGNPYAD